MLVRSLHSIGNLRILSTAESIPIVLRYVAQIFHSLPYYYNNNTSTMSRNINANYNSKLEVKNGSAARFCQSESFDP